MSLRAYPYADGTRTDASLININYRCRGGVRPQAFNLLSRERAVFLSLKGRQSAELKNNVASQNKNLENNIY